jgi:hypothetical protein
LRSTVAEDMPVGAAADMSQRLREEDFTQVEA